MCECFLDLVEGLRASPVAFSAKSFKYFSDALGPPVNLLIHSWRSTKTFHQIQEALAHGERGGDSAFIRSTARRGAAANIHEHDGAKASVLQGLVNTIGESEKIEGREGGGEGRKEGRRLTRVHVFISVYFYS